MPCPQLGLFCRLRRSAAVAQVGVVGRHPAGGGHRWDPLAAGLVSILFKKKDNELPSFFATNGNFIIGSVTGLVSLITLFKLLKQYWN